MPTARRALIAASLAGLALVAAGAGPSASMRLLTEPAGDDSTSALTAAVALAAWAVTGWLLLTAATTAGGHLPGHLGRAAAAIARWIAPAAVRRGVELALGLTVTTAVLGAGPAAASAPGLDWGTRVGASAPALDWGSAPAPEPQPEPLATSVVVAPGDSLWALAARDLAQRSATPPSDAAVAQAWPAWWAANREAVGPDPDLLHPGTWLTPPARP